MGCFRVQRPPTRAHGVAWIQGFALALFGIRLGALSRVTFALFPSLLAVDVAFLYQQTSRVNAEPAKSVL
jgi:hypothetical protein